MEKEKLTPLREKHEEITLSDLVVDIWKSRVFIVVFTALAVFCGMVAIAVFYPMIYETSCIVSLNFNGIEKKEYPNSKPFDKEDIISPEILSSALGSVDLGYCKISDLKGLVRVQAIVPPELKDKELEKKAENLGYIFPSNQYRITLRTAKAGLISNSDREALLHSIVSKYRTYVHDTFYFHSCQALQISPDLESISEYLDTISVLDSHCNMLLRYLDDRITLAPSFVSPTAKLSFIDLKSKIQLFKTIELQYCRDLVGSLDIFKNRQNILLQYKERISDLERQSEVSKKEAKIAADLLKLILASNVQSSASDLTKHEPILIDNKLVTHAEASQNISLLVKKAMDYDIEAVNAESEASRLKTIRDRLIGKTSSDYSKLDQEQVTSSIAAVCGRFRALTSVINDVSAELSNYLAAKAVILTKDPTHAEYRDINIPMVLAVVGCTALFAAIFLSLLVQYVRRIKGTNGKP